MRAPIAFSQYLLRFLLLMAIVLVPLVAHADMEAGLEFRFRANVGGDKIEAFQSDDGDEYAMRMGNHQDVGLGFMFSPWSVGKFRIDFETSIAYGFWSIGPDSTDDGLLLQRMPLELSSSLRYVVSKDVAFRLGPGATAHLATTLVGKGALDGLKEHAGVGIGIYGEAGAVFFRMLELTFRYTHMKQEFRGENVDASTLGGGLSMIFPFDL